MQFLQLEHMRQKGESRGNYDHVVKRKRMSHMEDIKMNKKQDSINPAPGQWLKPGFYLT